MVAPRQLVVVVEGNCGLGPAWPIIRKEYLDKIVRAFYGIDNNGQKLNVPPGEMALIVFHTPGPYSESLLDQGPWTDDVELYFHWLSSISFAGGGCGESAVAEALAEALRMCCPGPAVPPASSQGIERQKHVVLVAASPPQRLAKPVPRPPLGGNGGTGDSEAPAYWLADATLVAQLFPQCSVSLSIIAPRQLQALRSVYNHGKRNPRAAEPQADASKRFPNHMVLLSEGFLAARAALHQAKEGLRPKLENAPPGAAPAGSAPPAAASAVPSTTQAANGGPPAGLHPGMRGMAAGVRPQVQAAKKEALPHQPLQTVVPAGATQQAVKVGAPMRGPGTATPPLPGGSLQGGQAPGGGLEALRSASGAVGLATPNLLVAPASATGGGPGQGAAMGPQPMGSMPAMGVGPLGGSAAGGPAGRVAGMQGAVPGMASMGGGGQSLGGLGALGGMGVQGSAAASGALGVGGTPGLGGNAGMGTGGSGLGVGGLGAATGVNNLASHGMGGIAGNMSGLGVPPNGLGMAQAGGMGISMGMGMGMGMGQGVAGMGQSGGGLAQSHLLQQSPSLGLSSVGPPGGAMGQSAGALGQPGMSLPQPGLGNAAGYGIGQQVMGVGAAGITGGLGMNQPGLGGSQSGLAAVGKAGMGASPGMVPSQPGMGMGTQLGAQGPMGSQSGMGPPGSGPMGGQGGPGMGTMMPTPGFPGLGILNAAQLPSLSASSGQQSGLQSGGQPAGGPPRYIKLWEGALAGQRQGKPVLICKLEGYRQSGSLMDSVAQDWPPTMQIVRLIAQDYMNSKDFQGKAELLVFRPLGTHNFLTQMAEKKLCAVVKLPTQTLLLANVPDRPGRLIGMLFPKEMVILAPNSQQQQQSQSQSQPQQKQQQPQSTDLSGQFSYVTSQMPPGGPSSSGISGGTSYLI